MRTFLRGKITLLFMTCAVVLAIPAIALADNVKNDVVAGGNDTTTVGTPTTVNYEIQQTGSGGLGGCDATTASPVTVNINAPAGVTASPSSLSFDSCGSPKAVSFSSNTAGNYSITVSTVDNVGDYNPNPAAFTLHVTNPPPPPNTAPTLTLPGNQIAEATGPGGATVSFNATATDAEDNPDPAPVCSPASGSTFPVGSTQVNCSVQDSGGLTASGFFTVTVQDTTAPSLNLPNNQTAEATGPGGAHVTFSAPTANDIVDGAITPTCDAASGDLFPLGTTTVHCTATDAHGNSTTGSFTVTVQDTTPPTLNLPNNQTAEATGPGGATVNFTAPTATDIVDGAITPNCDADSGDLFPLGTTTVHCTATDAHGNSTTGSFTVTVEDTTAPVISGMPSDITKEATSTNGAPASWTAPTASDVVDGNVTVNCSPNSGSTFALGTTEVTCTATDAAGNSSSAKFKVNVAYGWSNFLQPINVTGNQSIFKMGSTVPVKFQLTGASSGITNGTFYLKYAYTGTGDNNGEMESVATTTGTTGTQFRYSEGQYIYNWSTKGVVTKPGNYELRVYTDADGTNLLGKVSIELKK